MNARYTKLFALPAYLYAAGSPIMIAAGNLLKDNQTGKVLAQLKLRNVGPRTVKAVKVRLQPLDTAMRPLGGALEFDYLDLRAARDEEFGQKTPVPLPDAAARGFTATVSEVTFEDNGVWGDADGAWASLPAAEPFAEDDAELAKQYRLRYGAKAAYKAARHQDLWRCACGALNRAEEPVCRSCGAELSALLACDLRVLTAEKDARLAEEKAAAEIAAAAEAARRAEEKAEMEAAFAAAKKRRARTLRIAAVICAVLVAGALFVKFGLPAIQNANAYHTAEELLAAGNYDAAIAGFEALGEYKDSADRARSIYKQHLNAILQKESAGGYVKFGAYEQDNDQSNGAEAIEWLVLAREEDRLLVISRDALDCHCYHDKREDITWEGCALRKWLNETFLEAAFTEAERSVIPTVTVTPDRNPKYSTDPGNATEDRVFLLSVREAELYFASDEDRACSLTEYAKAKALGYGFWCLRTPGDSATNSVRVLSTSGSIKLDGDTVKASFAAVRPALWIDIS